MASPMTQAILRLFGNLKQKLAERNVPVGAINAYIFGGSAVHLHTQRRASSDVDVEFAYDTIHKDNLVLVLKELPPIDYDDPEEGPSRLSYDPNFNTTFGPLHEGYRDRAVVLEAEAGSPVTVWLPSAEDIAVTKLGRLGDVDLEDILALLSLQYASWEQFERLATEAAAYYVGPDLTSNLAYVRKRWLDRRVS